MRKIRSATGGWIELPDLVSDGRDKAEEKAKETKRKAIYAADLAQRTEAGILAKDVPKSDSDWKPAATKKVSSPHKTTEAKRIAPTSDGRSHEVIVPPPLPPTDVPGNSPDYHPVVKVHAQSDNVKRTPKKKPYVQPAEPEPPKSKPKSDYTPPPQTPRPKTPAPGLTQLPPGPESSPVPKSKPRAVSMAQPETPRPKKVKRSDWVPGGEAKRVSGAPSATPAPTEPPQQISIPHDAERETARKREAQYELAQRMERERIPEPEQPQPVVIVRQAPAPWQPVWKLQPGSFVWWLHENRSEAITFWGYLWEYVGEKMPELAPAQIRSWLSVLQPTALSGNILTLHADKYTYTVLLDDETTKMFRHYWREFDFGDGTPDQAAYRYWSQAMTDYNSYCAREFKRNKP